MTYSTVLAAVVSALSAETVAAYGSGGFETRVQDDPLKGAITGKQSKLLESCHVFSRLHKHLSPNHWHVLLAKYSTHKGRKIDATGRLVSAVTSPAPHLFTRKAVTAWAIPQITKGVKRVAVRVEPPVVEGLPSWRALAAIKSVERANASEAAKAGSRSGDMVVLHPSNYDMTTWDSQGLAERTYQRWNRAIRDALEHMTNEALAEAQEILEMAGLLESEAA